MIHVIVWGFLIAALGVLTYLWLVSPVAAAQHKIMRHADPGCGSGRHALERFATTIPDRPETVVPGNIERCPLCDASAFHDAGEPRGSRRSASRLRRSPAPFEVVDHLDHVEGRARCQEEGESASAGMARTVASNVRPPPEKSSP